MSPSISSLIFVKKLELHSSLQKELCTTIFIAFESGSLPHSGASQVYNQSCQQQQMKFSKHRYNFLISICSLSIKKVPHCIVLLSNESNTDGIQSRIYYLISAAYGAGPAHVTAITACIRPSMLEHQQSTALVSRFIPSSATASPRTLAKHLAN